MPGRRLELVEVPTGEAVLELLPRLAATIDGSGPALLPVPVEVTARAPGLTSALGVGQLLDPGEDDPDDPTAVVVATSGSTGVPKGVLLPRSALTASAAAARERLGGAGQWLLAVPGWHIAGLQVLLRAVADGGEPTVLDTGKPFTAERFARAAAAMSAPRRYVSLVPTQLHRLLADPAGRESLGRFAGVLVGGAASEPALLADAAAAGVAVITTYGMSETSGGCVYAGRPLAGVRVQIDHDRTDDGNGRAEDTDGRVILSGPVVGRGYRRRPGHPAFATPGEFRTDDLGHLRDGVLTVTGRADDVIITGGLKVPPAAVEAVLAGRPGVARVVVVGGPDPQWGQLVIAVVVPQPAGPPTLADLRSVDLPAHYLPQRLVLVDELPERGPGKPDRAAIAALVAPS